MKNSIIIAALVVSLLSACSKSDKSTSVEDAASTNNTEVNTDAVALYERAYALSDPYTAVYALNQILLTDSNNYAYIDSLTRAYVQIGLYRTAAEVGQKAVDAQPENFKLLEVVGLCKEFSQDFDGAKEDFMTLYKEFGDEKYYYEIASIDFKLRNYESSLKKADEMIARKDKSDTKIEVEMTNGSTQFVPLPAASHYLKANVYAAQNKLQPAVNELRAALQFDRQFEAANVFLQRIQQAQQQQAQLEEYRKAEQRYKNRFGD